MRLFYILFFFFLGLQVSFAQDKPAVKDSTTSVTPRKTFRKYKRSEFNFILNRSILANQKNTTTAPLKPLGSGSLDLGFGYGFKFPSKWTLHIQTLVTAYKLNFDNASTKTFPDTLYQNVNTQKLRFMGASLPIGVIYNFKEKDKKRITYLELGVMGSIYLPPTYKIKYQDNNGNSVVEKRSIYFGLLDYSILQSGVYGRLGWKQFALYGKYRISNIFPSTFYRTDKPNISRLEAGISVML